MGNKATSLRRSILERLKIETRYTQIELKIIFNKFIEDYPEGTITKEEFENIYKKYFKKGRKHACKMSHHVFRVLDVHHDEKIGEEK